MRSSCAVSPRSSTLSKGRASSSGAEALRHLAVSIQNIAHTTYVALAVPVCHVPTQQYLAVNTPRVRKHIHLAGLPAQRHERVVLSRHVFARAEEGYNGGDASLLCDRDLTRNDEEQFVPQRKRWLIVAWDYEGTGFEPTETASLTFWDSASAPEKA